MTASFALALYSHYAIKYNEGSVVKTRSSLSAHWFYLLFEEQSLSFADACDLVNRSQTLDLVNRSQTLDLVNRSQMFDLVNRLQTLDLNAVQVCHPRERVIQFDSRPC